VNRQANATEPSDLLQHALLPLDEELMETAVHLHAERLGYVDHEVAAETLDFPIDPSRHVVHRGLHSPGTP
jgi:hypothetical protein